MISLSSSLLLCTVAVTSGGSNGIFSNSVKTRAGTVNRPCAASAARAGKTKNTPAIKHKMHLTRPIPAQTRMSSGFEKCFFRLGRDRIACEG
jgi:hypothetical protein